MRILIVGSKGFIGSHLFEHFTSDERNTVTGCDVKGESENNYIRIEKSVASYEAVLKNYKFDICIYAGGNGSVPYSIESPEMDFHLNTQAIEQMLSLISKSQPECKFVHISSAAVYGSPSHLPISESSDIKPLSPYGWNKYLSEIICKKYFDLYKINTVSLRVFSVYGERLTKQLFWDIYKKVQNTKEVSLFGTGNESRDFINIRDLVAAIDIIVRKAEFKGEVYNVSSGTETTIKNAAEMFCEIYDPELKVFFSGQTKAGDPNNWRADITKLNQLGFKAETDLRSGLERYVKWLKEKE